MKGDFDNSQEWLDGLGPNGWSTQETADRLARGMKDRTGREWVVTLCTRNYGPAGGFYIAPAPDRLVKGAMAASDLKTLIELFDARTIRSTDCRWYILPDETSTAIRILETGRPRRPRRSKVSQDETVAET